MRYDRPTTLAEALAIRAARNVTVMAGGTDIYPLRATQAAWGRRVDADMLDLTAIAALSGVSETASGFRIGALTRWREIVEAPLRPQFDGLKAAARQIGAAQVQNAGTLGGNLVTASPAGDSIPCLMALDAGVELVSEAGSRRLMLADFITGYRQTALQPHEIVAAVHVPRREALSCFLKLGARSSLVISIAMVSVVVMLENGRISHAALAVGACSPVAVRLSALEARLVGHRLTEAAAMVDAAALAGLTPIDDVRASGAYRLRAAEQLVRDALIQLGGRA